MALMLKVRLERLLCKMAGHKWVNHGYGSGKFRRHCSRCGHGQWRDFLELDWMDERRKQ